VQHSELDRSTSGLGQSRSFNDVRVTSALPPLATKQQTFRQVGSLDSLMSPWVDLVFERSSTRTANIVDHFQCANRRIEHGLLIR